MTTHVPLCTVSGCPAPSDPDWHHCFVCQNPQGDHAHVESRARAPAKKHDPDNIVFLCRHHHDMVDKTHECGHSVEEFPDHMLHYLYWKSGLVRKDLADRVIGEVGRSEVTAAGPTPHKVLHPPARLSDHPPEAQILVDGEPVPFVSTAECVISWPPWGRPETPPELAGGLPALTPAVSYERHALIIDGPLSWNNYVLLVGKLETAGRALNWWVGDAILAGEAAFGEKAYQPWEAEGHKAVWLQQCAWVAEHVPLHTRVQSLSWTHHREVAALPEPQQAEWLARAQAEGMSSRQLHECVATKRDPCSHEWVMVNRCGKCGKWEQ